MKLQDSQTVLLTSPYPEKSKMIGLTLIQVISGLIPPVTEHGPVM